MRPELAAVAREAAAAAARSVSELAIGLTAQIALATTALGFLTAGGFALLAPKIGPAAASFAFAAIYSGLALAALLSRRMAAARRRRRAAEAQDRIAGALATARALAGAAGAFAPLAAFVSAFLLARRR